jgi:D-beta-D-heptose 7-phosphate kinase/D-beta-D-heptose 1-phosphate adenosyltransferase
VVVKKVLVAGDFFLDAYTIGKASRLSPEAPVPIILVEKEEFRAGGAGNVTLNLIAQEIQVKAFGVLGQDEKGEILKKILDKEGVDTNFLFSEKERVTIVKHRVIANHQQIVRFDTEKISPFLSKELPFDEILHDVGVVAISDYGKGFLSRVLLKELIDQAVKRLIPVIADPKGRDFSLYSGATVIKPNETEAYEASGLDRTVSLEKVAQLLFNQVKMDLLMVTRSDKGISLFFPEGIRQDFPVIAHQVRDVTGAGDTVLATLAASFLKGVPLEDAICLSNIAASVAIERLGCAVVSSQEIEERMNHKVFA